MLGRKFVCACAGLLFSAPVIAASTNAFDYYQVYSAGDIGSATQSYGSDFQGTAGAGGDVFFTAFSANTFWKNDYGLHVRGNATLNGGSYYENVEVGGDLSVASLDINGDVFVGGNVTGIYGGTITGDLNAAGQINMPTSWTVNGTATANQPYTPVADYDAVESYFSSVSTYYGGMADTVGYTNEWDNLKVSLNSGMNVISMTADEFKNAWGLTVSGAGDGALIINLTGEVVSLDSTTLSGIDKSKVLLNYVDATSLQIGGGNTLNILAINADTTFASGNIDGNLIVGSLMGSGQVNEGSFSPGIEIVPEPTALAMLAVGGLLMSRRRRHV